MTEQEIAARFAHINELEAESPSEEDIAAIEAAAGEDAMPLETYKEELEKYSGRIVLRIPRSLHKALKDAAASEIGAVRC